MTLLQIVPSLNPKYGGISQGIKNSIPAIQENGHVCEVLTFDDIHEPFLKDLSFKIYPLGKGFTKWRYNSKYTFWLRNNLSRYDAVIINGIWSYQSYAGITTILGMRNKGKKTPKTYIMPHGMLDPYFQKAKHRKFKALRNTVYWKLFEKSAINNADAILFTCNEEMVLAQNTFPSYQPKKQANVSYGIASPPQKKESMKNALAQVIPSWNQHPFLLYLSRIDQKKGIDNLIKAYLKLENEITGLPQLIIAGPNDHCYGKKMQSLAANSPNIIFAGMLNGETKWGAYHNCEVFILPSHQENFGIAVVESLACGKPVLISNKINIWDVIENNKAGLITDDSQFSTYHILKRWMNLPESEKLKMSSQALNTFNENFTVEYAAKKFLWALKD